MAKSCKTIYDLLPKQKTAINSSKFFSKLFNFPSAILLHFSSVVNFYDPLAASISPFLMFGTTQFIDL